MFTLLQTSKRSNCRRIIDLSKVRLYKFSSTYFIGQAINSAFPASSWYNFRMTAFETNIRGHEWDEWDAWYLDLIQKHITPKKDIANVLMVGLQQDIRSKLTEEAAFVGILKMAHKKYIVARTGGSFEQDRDLILPLYEVLSQPTDVVGQDNVQKEAKLMEVCMRNEALVLTSGNVVRLGFGMQGLGGTVFRNSYNKLVAGSEYLHVCQLLDETPDFEVGARIIFNEFQALWETLIRIEEAFETHSAQAGGKRIEFPGEKAVSEDPGFRNIEFEYYLVTPEKGREQVKNKTHGEVCRRIRNSIAHSQYRVLNLSETSTRTFIFKNEVEKKNKPPNVHVISIVRHNFIAMVVALATHVKARIIEIRNSVFEANGLTNM